MDMYVWELDFYSRPVLDGEDKKIWELLVCDRDRAMTYAKLCPSTSVNSVWLAAELQQVLALTGRSPQKVRFYRPSMHNIITRGCILAEVTPQPSRRLPNLSRWLEERMALVYPQMEGFQGADPNPLPLTLGSPTPTPVPDALVGDRWQVVSLPVADFALADQWSMDFGELLDLSSLDATASLPGIVFGSSRALPLAAWMWGVDPVSVQFAGANLLLYANAEACWRVLTIPPEAIALGQSFEAAKAAAQGFHFMAIQADPEREHFEGFWLLQEPQVRRV
jgi:hypothetical protein